MKKIIHKIIFFTAISSSLFMSCKEEKLILPESSGNESIVSTTRPTARPTNLTVFASYNQVIEIHWPVVSDRVAKAAINYVENGQNKTVEVTSFNEPTLIHVAEIKKYHFEIVYFTADQTPSKKTVFDVQSQEFETVIKVNRTTTVPTEGGVIFNVPQTSETKDFKYEIQYSVNGVSKTFSQQGPGLRQFIIKGFSDDTKPVGFKLIITDIALNHQAEKIISQTPGPIPIKAILPSVYQYSADGLNGVIGWLNPNGYQLNVKVNYMLNGSAKEVVLSSNKTKDQITFPIQNLPFNATITFTDPEGNSVQKSVTITDMVLLSRSNWKISASSEELVGEGSNGPVSKLIDGDINSFWHSKWQNANTTTDRFPFYVTVDFGTTLTLSKIDMIRRHNNNSGGFRNFDIEISDNGTTWTAIQTNLIFLSQNAASFQEFSFSPVRTRYMRLKITSPYISTVTSTHLAELRAYGIL